MIKIHKTYFLVFLFWVLLVSIGDLIGFSLTRLITKNLDENRYFGLGVFSTLVLVGLFIGLGQWMVINSKLKKGWLWIPATMIGFSIGSFISYFIVEIVGENLFHLATHYFRVYQFVQPIVVMMIAGMFTGMLQWLSIRRKLITSIKWSLVSGLSLVVGFETTIFISNAYLTNYLGYPIFGLAVGIVSGLFVEPLLLRPESK